MARSGLRIGFIAVFPTATFCLALGLNHPASALECTAPSSWVERTICGSDELKDLDARIAQSEAALAAAADPRFREALATDGARWRQTLDGCRKADYPQACMERRHYARVDALVHLTGVVVGPRLFGNPLRGCWQHAETDDQAQACLDAKLADSLAGLAVAAGGVREALAAHDGAPGAAGDSLALFEAAETAFATHEMAACRSEAAALGSGRGRELGETMCRIMLIRERAVGILRFMPNLAAPWTNNIATAREAVDACLDRIGEGAVVGMAHATNSVRLRVETASGVRQDCAVDATGATIISMTEVAATDVAPDEQLARFVTGSEDVRPPQCGLVVPVRDGSDAAFGRLIVSGC